MRLPQHIAWHHFKFNIPANWETTSYSVEEREGRLEFSTRDGFQALVGWEPCKHAPEPEVIMASFLKKRVPGIHGVKGVQAADVRTTQAGDFIIGYYDEKAPCQAVGYLADEKKLIQWVFKAAPRNMIDSLFVPILKSFEPNRGPIREYSLFGLRMRLPAEYVLEDMAALPANVMIALESGKKARATFRRWGMPELVLQGKTIEKFYQQFLVAMQCKVQKVEKTEVAGMEGAKAVFAQRGEHKMDMFMGRLWRNGEALIWYNEAEKRIYAFEQIGPRKVPLLNPTDVFPEVFK